MTDKKLVVVETASEDGRSCDACVLSSLRLGQEEGKGGGLGTSRAVFRSHIT